MSESKLAKLIWQASKMLTALLEKEFGFGNKTDKPDIQARANAGY